VHKTRGHAQVKPVLAPCPICPTGKLVGRHIQMHRKRGELLDYVSPMKGISANKKQRIREERLRAQAIETPVPVASQPPSPAPVGTVTAPERAATEVLTMPLAAGPGTRLLKRLVEALPPVPLDLAHLIAPILVLATSIEAEHTVLAREYLTLAQRFETLRQTFHSIEHAARLEKLRS
jgi:hypothetical protein